MDPSQNAAVNEAAESNVGLHCDANNTSNDNVEDNSYETRTTLIVQRALNDAARRKKNVIVSGLPEDGNNGDDRTEFLKICEQYLTVKPFIADNKCIRLGKKLPGKTRQLLIRLNSEEAATSLIQSAPLLRTSSNTKNIYINPDLSPAAAKLAYEQRKRRRESRTTRQLPDYVPTVNVDNVDLRSPNDNTDTGGATSGTTTVTLDTTTALPSSSFRNC